MAVRDDEVDARDQPRRVLPWKEALGHLPALILTAGLFLYAYLSVCYERFYGRLGVDPNDVGLSYAGTLARSSGFVIVYLLAAVFATGLVALTRPFRHVEELGFYRWRLRLGVPYPNVMAAGAIVSLLVVSLFGWPVSVAGDAAKEVQDGHPVGTVRLPGPPATPFPFPPLPVLAIRADPATVEPAGKPADAPATERLRGRKLLYLGQSNGTVVLYDAGADRAVYVPASSIILRVSNCDVEPPPDPTCSATTDY